MLSIENPPSDSQFSSSLLKEIKVGVDDDNGNAHLPKFCIRDFVLQNRVKDIKSNWPFSHHALQFCFKHGVKDVLPPFQPLDSLRKLAESRLPIQLENIITPVQSEEEKELPSTSRTKPVSDLAAPVKKRGLSVKLSSGSGVVEPITKEDSSGVASESMASQVCPVCKTFSSSSNTTLNAHIDQCLTVEPMNKWKTGPNPVKHKIKPRRVRMMVDIYETAPRCTLEELDRRNGTHWALSLSSPGDESEALPEDNDKVCFPAHVEGIGDKDGVYIDSNGLKLRILSQLGDMPSSSRSNFDSKSSKLLDDENGCKVLSAKKRKLKFANHHSKQQEKLSPNGGYKPLVDGNLMRSDNLGIVKQWVGSKRTYRKKKIILDSGERMYSITSTDKHVDEEKNLLAGNVWSVDPPGGCFEQLSLRKKPRFSLNKQDSHLNNKPLSTDHHPIHGERDNSPDISRGKKELQTLRKNLLFMRRDSVPESKKNSRRRKFVLENWSSESDEEMEEPFNSEISRQKAATRSKLLSRFRKRRWASLNSDKVDFTKISLESHSSEDSLPFEAPSYVERSDEETFVVSNSGIEAYQELNGFCSEEYNPDLVMAMDDAHKNSYVDVVPIPGPPGCFLPSPGRAASEDHQPNSSLTSCKMHSSDDDEHETADDMDTSPHLQYLTQTSSVGTNKILLPESNSKEFNGNHSEVMFPSGLGGFKSPPVLRLMGKDLMVVNKDDHRPSPQTSMIMEHCLSASFSTIPYNYENNMPVSFRPTNGFTVPSKFSQPLISSMKCGSIMRTDSLTKCDSFMKEIIVIDDSEQSEAAALFMNAPHAEMKAPTIEHALYSYRSRDGNSPQSDGVDPNRSRWNFTSEGTQKLCPNSLVESRPSLYFSKGFS